MTKEIWAGSSRKMHYIQSCSRRPISVVQRWVRTKQPYQLHLTRNTRVVVFLPWTIHVQLRVHRCHTHRSFRYCHPDNQWRPFQWAPLGFPLRSCRGLSSPEIATGFCKNAEITGTILPHQTVCCGCLSFRLLGEQWCSIRLTARWTTWLPPSNRGSIMKQERSAARRAQSAAPCGHVRPLLPNKVVFTAYLRGFRMGGKSWALSERSKQDKSECSCHLSLIWPCLYSDFTFS